LAQKPEVNRGPNRKNDTIVRIAAPMHADDGLGGSVAAFMMPADQSCRIRAIAARVR
jgi:hypothetical protein